MNFSVHKNIIRKKQSSFKGFINILILLLAIPVIVIAGISLSVYFLTLWLVNKIFRKKHLETAADHYHLELELIHNEHLHITLVEDEFDTELTRLNEAWQETVYNDETCLYRILTSSPVSGLANRICCFYYKEQPGGVLLQILPEADDHNGNNLDTDLVFVNYNDFNITRIDRAGPFFLFNDDKNPGIIKGFNKKEEINIIIVPNG